MKTPVLKLKLLGQIECKLPSGQLLSLSTRKSEILLAYLALAPGIRHPRDRLINLLWSDRGEDQARNSLRQSLSSIKKAFESELFDLLQIDRTTIKLTTDHIRVDVHEFEQLIDESTLESLSKAAELYQGEFLEGVTIRDTACQEWLSKERDRLSRLIVEALFDLGQLQIAESQYSLAIESTERLVDYDPLQESGWRLLMTAYHQKGDRNHALMVYKRCCEILEKELGVEPEVETSELQEQIKQASPSKSVSPGALEKQKPKPTANVSKPAAKEHSILVLPFNNLSDDPEQQYFSNGLTEGLIMGLSLFPSLRVHSRHSSFAASEQDLSISEIGQKFDSLYVVEGSVRKTPDQVRISAQLVDTQTGEQIWGQRFDNRIEETFALEDQVTQSIVAIIKGRIDITDQEIAYRKPAKDMQSYDLLMRGTYHLARFNPEDNHIGMELLHTCLKGDPGNATAHYWMYRFHILDWISAWSYPRSEMLAIADDHIIKAIEIEPENSVFQASYAEYLVFIKEYEQAAVHADRALKLNSNDTETMATVSAVQACLGNVQAALEMADSCRHLDPFHPWVDWVTGIAYYRGEKYQDALNAFQNMANPADEIDGWIAACHQRLGDHDNASKHLNLYLDTAKKNMAKFPQSLDEWKEIWTSSTAYRAQEGIDYPFEALCEAGLTEFVEKAVSNNVTETTHSIAILPFDNLSGDPEQEYFSDGITESIILNLSLFPGIQVKSRNSSFAFKSQIKSLGEISKELNVDYVVEGSIRKSSDRIRITVQLIEGASGNQIWGKRYDAELEDLFSLEEELSRTIAATVTGQIESDLQRIAIARGASHQSSYDLLLSGTYHCNKFTGPDMVIAIDKLNQCLVNDPDNVRAHATLFFAHAMNWLERWIKDFQPAFKLAGEHASKALKLGPEVGYVNVAYGEYMIFCRNYSVAEIYIDKALEINPNDPDALTIKAFSHGSQGEFDFALKMAELAYRLDPYHPFADWVLAEYQFLCGRYEDALDTIAKSRNAPGFIRIYNVAANIKLGRIETARQALQVFLQECRETMLSMPQSLDEWLQYTRDNAPFENTQINEEIVDYLVQAGLENYLESSTDAAMGATGYTSSIAVLPFDNLSGDPGQEYFSDGITESIILNLSLFPELIVKSRNSSFAFKQQLKDLGEISRELNVGYLVEGSIRKSTDRIRITVQLIEAATGNQVWGKRYDAEIKNLFNLEEDLSRTIAATVTGQIDSDLQRIAIAKGAANQDSYDLLLDGIYHCYKFTQSDTIIAIKKLNQCLESEPDNVRAHNTLFICHLLNYLERWVVDHQASFEQAGVHISRSLSLDPDIGAVQSLYGEYLIFAKQPGKALGHVNKALQINPNDPVAITMKAFALEMMGEFEQALELAELGHRLDPYFPWADWNLAECQIFSGQYEKALETIANSKNDPELLKMYYIVANIKLNRKEPARQALKEFLQECRNSMATMPTTMAEWLQYSMSYTPFEDASLNKDIIDCLVQAGLEEALQLGSPQEDVSQHPAIIVLPFENLSGDPEQEYFSDGITESIILNLSSFSGLKVKSRHSSFALKNSDKNITEIGDELEVQYIVEGSVRSSSGKIRITVQLVEAESGNQIWGKRYDSELDRIFELEEEFSQTIAGTISGRIGKQVKLAKYQKPAKNLKSYDYLMRGWYHAEKLNAADTTIAIEQFQNCIEIDPQNADAHTMLTAEYHVLLFENWSDDRAKTLELARQHIEKALEIEPDNALAHSFMAEHYQYKRDFEQAMFHADKTLELNPTLPDGYSMKAYLLASIRQYEEAVKLAERSIQIDPLHPYISWAAGEVFRSAGENERAIKAFRSVPHTSPSMIGQISACLVDLGELDAARVEMKQYLELARQHMPNYPTSIEQWRQLWYEITLCKFEEDFETLFSLLLKAGLCDHFSNTSDDLPSIAVLPFENMSDDAEQEYFSDGITTDIISTLSRFRHIRVVSRYSTIQYKSQKASISEIAEQQGVRYILEGSVRKSGDRIRVNADLIDSSNEEICWRERYDRDLDDIFAVQDEITKNIVVAMKVHFEDGDKAQQLVAGTTNIKAWELVLIAVDLQDTYIRQNILDARSMIKQALELDPDYCNAWVMLGWTHWQEAYSGWCESFKNAMQQAENAVTQAFDLDSDNAEAWALKGTIHLMNHEAEAGRSCCKKAVELQPGNAEMQALMAFSFCFIGEFEEASEHYETTLKLCPVCPNWYSLIGSQIKQHSGYLDEAIEILRQAIDVEPDSPLCRFYLIDVMLEKGDEASARRLADEIRALDKSVNGKGLVQSYSQDKSERDRFQANLAKMGFTD